MQNIICCRKAMGNGYENENVILLPLWIWSLHKLSNRVVKFANWSPWTIASSVNANNVKSPNIHMAHNAVSWTLLYALGSRSGTFPWPRRLRRKNKYAVLTITLIVATEILHQVFKAVNCNFSSFHSNIWNGKYWKPARKFWTLR